jgi:hypothetical protein
MTAPGNLLTPAPNPRGALAPRRIPRMAELLRQAIQPPEDADRRDVIEDIIEGLKLLDAKREVCTVADEMYDGDVGMVFASEPVRRMLDRAGVEALDDFNYAHIPVDAVAERLQISSVVAAPAEENADGQEAEETAAVKAATKAIAKLRKDNELDDEEKRLHLDASKHGDCYVFVWPATDADGKATVDIRVNSAHNVIMVYDEEDSLKPVYALKSWRRKVGDREAVRANIYYPDRTERWVTEVGTSPDKRDSWFRFGEEIPNLDGGYDSDGEPVDPEEEFADLAADEFADGDDSDGEPDLVPIDAGVVPNPYRRIPWFHYRNNRPVGIPEHRNAYGPQTLINKLVYALAGNVDFQSLRQKYILVDPMQDDPLSNSIDPDHPDDEDDDPESDGGTSGLRSSPGEIWRLYGKAVGEFAAADPAGLIALFDRCVKAMAELTGLPQWAFSRASAELPSGEMVREANGDLTTKVQDRQKRYGPKWQDVYEFALKILGIEGVTVDVRWAPFQMVNDVAGWQVIQAKINAGVPPKVALEEAGYPPEHVDEWLTDASGADVGRRVALLNQIATATQALGAAIVTGAVSAPQVQQLISGLFNLTMEGTDVALPEPKPDDFVDPQAQLKLQEDLAKGQQDHQGKLQQAQLDHATKTQETSQEHAAKMAEEAHKRMQETMQAGGGPAGGRRPGSKPGPTVTNSPRRAGR